MLKELRSKLENALFCLDEWEMLEVRDLKDYVPGISLLTRQWILEALELLDKEIVIPSDLHFPILDQKRPWG